MLEVRRQTTCWYTCLQHNKVASDANFRQLAKEEEVKYEQGEQMTARSLMAFMLSQWEIMKNKNEWEAPSQEEQQLMVMRAEIDKLKQKKPAQGQQSIQMKKLMDKLGNKVQVAKNVRQGGKYKGIHRGPRMASQEHQAKPTYQDHAA
jgi:hypothetical protein